MKVHMARSNSSRPFVAPAAGTAARNLSVLLALAAVSASGLAQQGNTAGIYGTVLDAEGASIAGATVAVTQTETGRVRTVASEGNGQYRLQFLPVGHYQLKVDKAGFSSVQEGGILLEVNADAKLDVRMNVGQVTTSVEVNSGESAVQTQGAAIKAVIDAQRVVELPLDGRNLADLALLSPGVNVAQNTNGTGTNGEGDGVKIAEGSRQFSINGTRNNETRYTLDGADNNDNMYASGMPFPFPDAAQEFSVVTAGKGADTGSSAGGTVNIVTKSGTNGYHGDVFWFVRNTAFDANNFFSSTGDQLKRNQGGATFGLPLIKNKLFLFAGWQGTWNRQVVGSNLVQAVPAAFRKGDFSNLLTQSTPVQLVDPSTGLPYPNNQIPTAELSPAMQRLMTFWPTPNAQGLVAAPVTQNSDIFQYVGRADYSLNSKQTVYARYLLQSASNPRPLLDNNLATSQDGNKLNSHSGTVGWTWAVSQNLIADTHVYLNYAPAHRILDAPWGNVATALGIQINPLAQEMDIGLSGSSGFGLGSDARSADFRRSDEGVSSSWRWVKGKNNLTFGGELRWTRYNENNPYHSSGVFHFDGRCTGYDQADAMIGCLSEFTQGIGEFENRRNHYQALFAGDSIRLTPRVTLDLGLRWEPYTPITDTKQRNVLYFQDAYDDGAGSQKFVNSPPGLFYPGDVVHGHKVSDGATNARWNQFGPRVGAAWDVLGNGRMSLRAGVGMYYSSPEAYLLNALSDQAPFGYDENFQGGNFDQPYLGRESANVFPLPPGFLTNPQLPFQTPIFVYAQVQNWKLPLTYAWNIALQQEVAKNWVMQLAYVGNQTNHLAYTQDINAPVYDHSLTEQENNNNQQARRPRSQYERLYLLESGQNADYNGLQASLNHRITAGLNLNLSYTFSKALDYSSQNGSAEEMNGGSSTPDPFNPFLFRGPSDFDRRHVFVSSVVYDTPRIRLDHALPSLLLNQWQIGAIVTAQTGYPFSITTTQAQAGCGDGCSPHPDSIGPLTAGNGRSRQEMLNHFFNTENVVAGAPGTFGTIGRNSVYGPHYTNVDMNVVKQLPLHFNEQTNLELRAEAFNVLNHPNFSNPDSSFGDSVFGVITSTQTDARILQFAVKIRF